MCPSRNLSPSWKMTGRGIFLMVLTISVPRVSTQSPSIDEIENQCPTNARVNLTGGTLDPGTDFMVKSGYVFPPDSRWIENGDIFGCVCYNRSRCLPLYCPAESAMYHQLDPSCEKLSSDYKDYESVIATAPVVYSLDPPIETVAVNDRHVYTESSYGNCRWLGEVLVFAKSLEKGIYLQTDGGVYIPGKNISEMYNFDSSCLCSDNNYSTTSPMCLHSGVVHTTVDHTIIDTSAKGASMVVHVGMIVSIPFLLATFIVYTILPEIRNIHGFTLRGYVGCLLVAYTTLAVVQITGPISDLSCLFFAFVIYFTFLASFFWLNVMCFDMWWTFGGFRSLRGNVEIYDGTRIFAYSIYAFGCPTLLTAGCMIMDLASGIPDDLIRPEFGMESNCWFKTNEATALYFYGPIAVTIICNIFFFVSTTARIIRDKRDAARNLGGTDSRRHNEEKEWFNLYLKLFIVMGINWSMEIIAWLFKGLEYIWFITDLGNALQGLIIFIIFICKKKIMRLLIKRFGCLENVLSQDSTRGTNSSTNPTGTTSIPHS